MADGCGPFSTIRTHIAPAALHVYFHLCIFLDTSAHAATVIPTSLDVLFLAQQMSVDLHMVTLYTSLAACGASNIALGVHDCIVPVPFVTPGFQGRPGSDASLIFRY
jgi:hypothetical protein